MYTFVMEEFEKYYRFSLTLPNQKEALEELVSFTRETRVTVLCVCPSGKYCHTETLLKVCEELMNE